MPIQLTEFLKGRLTPTAERVLRFLDKEAKPSTLYETDELLNICEVSVSGLQSAIKQCDFSPYRVRDGNRYWWGTKQTIKEATCKPSKTS